MKILHGKNSVAATDMTMTYHQAEFTLENDPRGQLCVKIYLDDGDKTNGWIWIRYEDFVSMSAYMVELKENQDDTPETQENPRMHN